MKTLKYTIGSIIEYVSIIERFSLLERSSLSDILTRIKNKDLSILFSVSDDNKLNIKIYYSKIEFEEISSSQKSLFLDFYEDNSIFTDFKYKIKINNNSEFINKFLEDNNFIENNVDRNKRFLFIGVFDAYKSSRKIYNFLDDEYLFSRYDEFKKVDIEMFKDIIFVRNFLNIEIQ